MSRAHAHVRDSTGRFQLVRDCMCFLTCLLIMHLYVIHLIIHLYTYAHAPIHLRSCTYTPTLIRTRARTGQGNKAAEKTVAQDREVVGEATKELVGEETVQEASMEAMGQRGKAVGIARQR